MNLRLAYHPQGGGGTLTDIKLAYNPGPVNSYKALESPTVRLGAPTGGAAGGCQGGKTLSGPTVRLAHKVNNQGDRTLEEGPPDVRLAVTTAMTSNANHSGKWRYPHHVERTDEQEVLCPALLVSYVYLEPFLKHRHKYHFRDWVLDSGAFSAHQSGTEIKLENYIDTCKRLLAEDEKLTEVYSLDVIGDWRASIKNTEAMWKAGVEAIPCFHVGEPEAELKQMAKDYPKIALGGAVGFKGKDKWAQQCFARVWPKAIHGFGFGSEKSVLLVPWHSVDATNWEIGPCKYGRWNTFGKMSVRGSKQNLRSEVEWYLALERRARQKWRREMEQIGTASATDRPTEMSPRGSPSNGGVGPSAPSVRLAGDPNCGGGTPWKKGLGYEGSGNL